MQHYTVETASGSRYEIVRLDGGAWWMSGRNVPNPRSLPLRAEDWWPIAPVRPWPPVRGTCLWIAARVTTPGGAFKHMPGGGKFTSPVRRVSVCDAGAGAIPTLEDFPPPT
jgi:hypothetical protein